MEKKRLERQRKDGPYMGTGLGFGLRLLRDYDKAPKKGSRPRTTHEVHLRAETGLCGFRELRWERGWVSWEADFSAV